MCCQAVPFNADNVKTLFAKQIKMPTPDPRELEPEIPDDLREFILRATAKDRDERYATCGEARVFLRAAAEMPVLDAFAMSSLSVTYHTSRQELVEEVMREAVSRLQGVSGVALFEAHRSAGSSED